MFDQIKMTKKFISTDEHGARTFKVSLRYNKKQYTCNYTIGSALTEDYVSVKNVMFSILLDMSYAGMSFNDFCRDFGYNNDSIRDHKIWMQCNRTAKRINAMFTQSELDTMRELLVDY